MTLNLTPAITGVELCRRVEDLVPSIRERGPEGEELRRLPDATLRDLEEAGVLRAMRPEEVGGLAVDLATFADVTRVVSRGDASAGWIAAFLMTHAWMLTKLGPEAQAEIFAGQAFVAAAATITQPGTATAVPGGHQVSGRWRFGSGIMHSQWVMLMALADTGPLLCVVPIADVTIHDTWHVPGMKGTGSNDVEATALFVPAHRAVPFDLLGRPDCPGAELYDYPLLRYSPTRVLPLIHAAVALGTADAALELFRASAENRLRLPTLTPILSEPMIHEAYAEACAARRCAELLLTDAIAIIDAAFGADGAGLTLEQRAEINLAVAGAGHRSFTAVDLIVRSAGASIHRTGNPLDRVCRDTQVMRNHTVVDWRFHAATSGRVLLGQGLGTVPEQLF